MAARKDKANGGSQAVKTTIRINGGKEHEMSENGEIGPEAQSELEEMIAKSLGKEAPAKDEKGDTAALKLRSYIARIERLEEEKAGIGSDVRDVFSEAKSNGFCTKTMREVLKLRKMKPNDRTEQAYMLDLYKRALGMQLSLELEEAA